MNSQDVRRHFEAIRRESQFVDSYDMTTILKALIGRPLEACMPGADRTAVLLAERGHVDESSAVVTAGRTRVWSPLCTSPYRRCLVVDSAEGRYAVFLHLGNEPKPWHAAIDAMFDEKRAAAGSRVALARRMPGPAEGVVVCRVWPDAGRRPHEQPTLSEAMAADAEEGYMPTMCFSRNRSIGGYRDDRDWHDGHDDLRGDGMDAWPTFFRRLVDAGEAAGALPAFHDGLTEVAGRRWTRPDRRGLETLAACEAFADALHMEHGLLLGAETAGAVQALQGMTMEVDAERLVERLTELRSILQEGGHVGQEAAYVCNDLDNRTWLDEDGATVFEDQNRTVRVDLDDSSLGTEDLRYGLPPVRFALEEGKATIQVPPSLDVESARTWNSLVLNAESVLCCIGEEARCAHRP